MTDDDDKMTGYRSTKDPYAPLPGFVPEGLNDRTQAIYCLGSVRNEIRPVGYGVTGNWRLVKRLFQAINCLATIVLSLRDYALWPPNPGNCPPFAGPST